MLCEFTKGRPPLRFAGGTAPATPLAAWLGQSTGYLGCHPTLQNNSPTLSQDTEDPVKYNTSIKKKQLFIPIKTWDYNNEILIIYLFLFCSCTFL